MRVNRLRQHDTLRPVCLAFSPGGHRAQLQKAIQGIDLGRAYEVTFQPAGSDFGPVSPCVTRRYVLVHPRRRLWRTLANLAQAVAILASRKPWLIVSTGADVVVPTVVLGKIFLRSRVVFIETCGAIEPTLSGRICYRFSDLFIVQWPELLERYPRATLAAGPLV